MTHRVRADNEAADPEPVPGDGGECGWPVDREAASSRADSQLIWISGNAIAWSAFAQVMLGQLPTLCQRQLCPIPRVSSWLPFACSPLPIAEEFYSRDTVKLIFDDEAIVFCTLKIPSKTTLFDRAVEVRSTRR